VKRCSILLSDLLGPGLTALRIERAHQTSGWRIGEKNAGALLARS